MKRILISILLIALVLPMLAGCGATLQTEGEQLSVTDLLDRQVSIPAKVEKVVAIGPGALRLYTYAASIDLITGVEEVETGAATGKPYLYANPALAKLPVIGLGGPNNAPDPEKILTVKPDIIFSTYASDAAAADELQNKTGIPVIVISYGKTAVFDPSVDESLQLIGQITGQETKAKAAITYIQQAHQDLQNRTKDIPDAEKPSVYIGGLGAKGTHGIESTQANYSLFVAINAKNVVDETEKTGSVMIDKEKLIEWNPDVIIIDQGGYAAVLEDYQKNASFYNSLSAVQNGKTYAQLPYNYYSANIDTAIADAYYLGSILYPDAFTDIDPVKKADEIYQALLGAALYDQMAKEFGGFGVVKFE